MQEILNEMLWLKIYGLLNLLYFKINSIKLHCVKIIYTNVYFGVFPKILC